MNRVVIPAFVLTSLLVTVLGCGAAPDKHKAARPKTVPASGTVTYQGQPLEGATVVIAPTSAAGVAASAKTDLQGNFELLAYPPDAGAVPGEYTVTITKMEVKDVPEITDDSHDAEGPATAPAKSLIPKKYSLPKSSGLKVSIPESGITDIKFDLVD